MFGGNIGYDKPNLRYFLLPLVNLCEETFVTVSEELNTIYFVAFLRIENAVSYPLH